jgi:hypothetical protein
MIHMYIVFEMGFPASTSIDAHILFIKKICLEGS